VANLMKIAAIILTVLSLIGGGIILYYYSLDASNLSTLFFQIVLALSVTMFISGIALAFLSRKKPALYDEVRQAVSQAQVTNAAPEYVNAPSMTESPRVVVREDYQRVVPARPEPVKQVLSFEEEMRLSKLKYYSEATKSVEEEVVNSPPVVATPSPTPIKPEPISNKVTLKFESPFGKKKPVDPLRQMLDKEESDSLQAGGKQWKSY
jgi:hypothetical protein